MYRLLEFSESAFRALYMIQLLDYPADNAGNVNASLLTSHLLPKTSHVVATQIKREHGSRSAACRARARGNWHLSEDGRQFSDLAYQAFSRLARVARSSFKSPRLSSASPATCASDDSDRASLAFTKFYSRCYAIGNAIQEVKC
jgi:hypothetical protein